MSNETKFKQKIITEGGLKIPSATGNRALTTDANNNIVHSAVTDTELGRLSGVTGDIQTQLDAKIDASEKGAANGVATLDANGKLPSSQLTVDAVEYKGTYDASTNTPSLADGVGNKGDLYRVNVAGTQNFGSGNITFAIGDNVVYNGTVWEKWVSSGTSPVTSVFGRTGAVTAQSGDYTASQLTNVPSGNISATTVQAAIDELEAEKQSASLKLASFDTNTTEGIIVQTDDDTVVARSVTSSTLNVTNGDGVAGNIAVEMPTLLSGAAYNDASKTLAVTVDNQGRITAIGLQDIAIDAAQVTDFDTAVLAVEYSATANPDLIPSNISLTDLADKMLDVQQYVYRDIAKDTIAGAESQTNANLTPAMHASVKSYKAQVSVAIDATSPLYEVFDILAIKKGATWDYSMMSTGDDSLVTLSVDATTGRVLYSSASYTGFLSMNFYFRVETTVG